MKTILNFKPSFHKSLWSHLLPRDSLKEQAAFLYCMFEKKNEDIIVFNVADFIYLNPSDFAAQYGDYLELKDETHIALIKQAHTLGASLVELHSHLGSWPAEFSLSDQLGLLETVPHMRWRLKQRPYIAIVVASSGFDALCWLNSKSQPDVLTGIQVGDVLMKPTNLSLERWYGNAK